MPFFHYFISVNNFSYNVILIARQSCLVYTASYESDRSLIARADSISHLAYKFEIGSGLDKVDKEVLKLGKAGFIAEYRGEGIILRMCDFLLISRNLATFRSTRTVHFSFTSARKRTLFFATRSLVEKCDIGRFNTILHGNTLRHTEERPERR